MRLLKYHVDFHLTNTASCIDWTPCEHNSINSFFIRNESWVPIKYMASYLVLESMGAAAPDPANEFIPDHRCIINDNTLQIKSVENQPLRWIFCQYKHPVGVVYRVEMIISLQSIFTEFQFALNFRSIANRVRFMLVNNQQLIFQIVKDGVFFPYICNIPLRLELNRIYKISIEVVNHIFNFYLDGQLLVSISCIYAEAKPDDKFAIIFFEESEREPILASILDIRIYEGKHYNYAAT
jgi:hypothetical protein